MRRTPFFVVAAVAAAFAASLPAATPVLAQSQGVVAVVNDLPVTERDLTQRIALLTLIGDAPRDMSRKQALQSIIDDEVKIAEATRLRLMPTEAEISDRIERLAKGMKTSPDGLMDKLKKQGVSEKTFRRYIGAVIGFNRIISARFQTKVEVSDSEVDAKLAEIKGKINSEMDRIMKDPRMKPVTVYSVLEVTLPVEGEDPMLLQSRAIEAAQYMKNFKGCGSARAAAEGIFNVKIGKKIEADASKLPKQLKAALDKVGEGRAVGPMRDEAGIKLIAFCDRRTITPEKPDIKVPSREQVERLLLNERFASREEELLRTIRGRVYVEYRNANYALQ